MFLQRGVLQPRKEAAVNFGCPPVYHAHGINQALVELGFKHEKMKELYKCL